MSDNRSALGRGDERQHGRVLFEFVRHWWRRSNAPADRVAEQNGKYAIIIEAVDFLETREIATINSIAAQIGIDQSGASRIVKDAIAAGYLEMRPRLPDARKKEVIVSARGRRLLAQARAWQEDVFLKLTHDWSDEERSAFHKAMHRLLDRSRQIGI